MYCPNRWDLLGQLSQLDSWAIGRRRTTLATVRQLNRTVGISQGVHWHMGFDDDLDPGDNTVGAVYDSVLYELDNPTYIDAFVYIGSDSCIWSEDSWLHFKRKVADTICHEHIHVMQEDDDEENTSSGYLSSPREIDAYAFNVAAEMHDYWKDDAAKALKDWRTSACIDPPLAPSLSLWSYVDEFGMDSAILPQLVERAGSYLREIKKQLDNTNG